MMMAEDDGGGWWKEKRGGPVSPSSVYDVIAERLVGNEGVWD
jgi:hypothetical protein